MSVVRIFGYPVRSMPFSRTMLIGGINCHTVLKIQDVMITTGLGIKLHVIISRNKFNVHQSVHKNLILVPLIFVPFCN